MKYKIEVREMQRGGYAWEAWRSASGGLGWRRIVSGDALSRRGARRAAERAARRDAKFPASYEYEVTR